MVARAVEHDRGDVVRISAERLRDRVHVLRNRLGQVDATARRAPPPSCGRTSAELRNRAGVADRDHRHRAVAAAGNDDGPLERVDREIDRLASAADDGVAAKPLPSSSLPITTFPRSASGRGQPACRTSRPRRRPRRRRAASSRWRRGPLGEQRRTPPCTPCRRRSSSPCLVLGSLFPGAYPRS